MRGYCRECGSAIYTQDDLGLDDTYNEFVTIGVTPWVKGAYIPVRSLVCRSCVDEHENIKCDEIEAAYQVWAEQECRGTAHRAQ